MSRIEFQNRNEERKIVLNYVRNSIKNNKYPGGCNRVFIPFGNLSLIIEILETPAATISDIMNGMRLSYETNSFILISLIVCYILSCLIVRIYDRFRKVKKK